MATGLPLLTYGLAEIGAPARFASAQGDRAGLIGHRADRRLRASTRCGCRSRCSTCACTARPTFSSASFAMFCLGAALFGGMILLPLYWQDVRLESVVDTGLLTAPQGLGAALVMPLAGKLTDRYRRRPAGAVRRDRDDGRDDPVRADRRPHLDRLAVASRCSSAGSGSASASCRRWRRRSPRSSAPSSPMRPRS